MAVSEDYQDYPVFKGLQRPLEFMGFQGRYIYWAAGTAGGAIIIFIIGYLVAGFITGLVLASSVITFGGVMIFIRQRKGLHTKAVNKGIYIFAHSMRRIS